jgi:carbon-monoxide dehydrogenase small subunit
MAMTTDDKLQVRFELNGTSTEMDVPPRLLLADALRTAGALGTHLGCEHGVCGACTVLVNGDPVRSCLMLAVQADGCSIETVESLARADGELSALQDALHRHHGLQCGFCTPGILMSLEALLRETASPSEDMIRETLQGHLCRCTGYEQIVDAVLDVVDPGANQ